METEPTKHTTLIVFGAFLGVAIIISLAVYFIMGTGSDVSDEFGVVGTTPEIVASQKNFNTAVLDRAEYRDLDGSLFTRGLIPVTPPTGTGKTNLFQ